MIRSSNRQSLPSELRRCPSVILSCFERHSRAASPPLPPHFFYIFLSVFFLRLYLQTCRPLSCKSDSYVSGELLLSESVDSSSIVVLQRWRKGRKRRRNRRRRRANNNNQITSCQFQKRFTRLLVPNSFLFFNIEEEEEEEEGGGGRGGGGKRRRRET